MSISNSTKILGNSKAAVAFLRDARANGPWTLAAIPTEGGAPEVVTFYCEKEIPGMQAWIDARNGRANLYWTVNPTRERINRKPKKMDISRYDFAFVDCDPMPDEPAMDAKNRHRLALMKLPNPPSVIYESGNGIVGLWKIQQPIKIKRGDANAIAECEAVNIGLKDALGGKAFGYDDCHNLDRLARLPGTVNIPNAKKRAAGREASLAGNVQTFPNSYSIDQLPRAAVLQTEDDQAPSIIGPIEQVDSLDELHLSERTRTIIECGRVEGETKPKDDSDSAWRYDGLRSMFREGVTPEQAVGILTDDLYGISSGITKKDVNPEAFARAEVSRALRKLEAEKREDIALLAAEPINDNYLDEVLAADKKKRLDGIARFKAIRFSDLEKAQSPQYVLQDVITENSLFEFYGKQKSGKTLWALALSLSIACELEFYGRKVKHGKSLYIVGEGNKVRFGHRVKAWIKRTSQIYRISEKELRARIQKNWELVPIPVMISTPQQVADFLAANKAEGPRVLIVIDTLMRTFDGNINEQNDMMRYVRGCDEIREGTGAAVLIVHHPGLAASNRGAGSVSLPAAVDGIGKFYTAGKQRVFKVDMLRDGDSDQPPMVFNLETVTVDFDFETEGKETVSAYLALADTVDPKTEEYQLLLRIRDEMPTSQRALVNDFTSKSAVSRRIAKLIDCGYLEPGGLRLTDEGEQLLSTLDLEGSG